jgi:hypothetical protein
MSKSHQSYKEKFSFNRPKKEIEINVEEILNDFIQSPAFKFVTIGLTAAFLVRMAKRLESKYPEVSDFINDNIGILDEKINNIRSDLKNPEIPQKH